MKQIVYVASPDSWQIHVWLLNNHGKLILLQIIDTPGQVQPMVINLKKKMLYAGVRPNFGIIVFKIEASTGKLIKIQEIALPGSPTNLSLDKKSKYLFCSSYKNSFLSVSLIKSDGLPQPPHQIINNLPGCHAANMDLFNKILYVTVLQQDKIYLFQLNNSGYLKKYKFNYIQTTPKSGPRHISFHNNGNYAYSINELNGTVDIWDTIPTPHLIQNINIMPITFTEQCWAADIHLTPNSHFLYTCERKISIITIFKIRNHGKFLSKQGYHYLEKAIQPRAFGIDNNGKFLIVSGQKSNVISLYKINQNNGLLNLSNHYIVGQGPMWILIYSLD